MKRTACLFVFFLFVCSSLDATPKQYNTRTIDSYGEQPAWVNQNNVFVRYNFRKYIAFISYDEAQVLDYAKENAETRMAQSAAFAMQAAFLKQIKPLLGETSALYKTIVQLLGEDRKIFTAKDIDVSKITRLKFWWQQLDLKPLDEKGPSQKNRLIFKYFLYLGIEYDYYQKLREKIIYYLVFKDFENKKDYLKLNKKMLETDKNTGSFTVIE